MNKQYTAVDRSAQLRHWKYIKKKRGKNGKWIYYYDKEKLKDDLGFDEREAAEKARNDYSLSLVKAHIAKENARKGYDETTHKNYTEGKTQQERVDIVDRASDNYKKASDNAIKSAYKYAAAHKAYMNTPLGKLENFINKGAKFLEKIFG
jgi:hypothetical protein